MKSIFLALILVSTFASAQEFIWLQLKAGQDYPVVTEEQIPILKENYTIDQYEEFMGREALAHAAYLQAELFMTSLEGVEVLPEISGVFRNPTQIILQRGPTGLALNLAIMAEAGSAILILRIRNDRALAEKIAKIVGFVQAQPDMYRLGQISPPQGKRKTQLQTHLSQTRLKYLLRPDTVEKYYEPIQWFNGKGQIHFTFNPKNSKLLSLDEVFQEIQSLLIKYNYEYVLPTQAVNPKDFRLEVKFNFDPTAPFVLTRLLQFKEDLRALNPTLKTQWDKNYLVQADFYSPFADIHGGIGIANWQPTQEEWNTFDNSNSSCARYFAF